MADKAQVGNWDEDFKIETKNTDSNKSRKLVFMNLNKPGNYRIRLVGDYIVCRKHFRPYKATVQDDEKNIDPAWQAGFYPSKRYAINVIDKTGLKPGEVGTLKILEKGIGVFKVFSNYKTVYGIDPSRKEGPDFNITVEIPDPQDPLTTEYTVMPLEKAPFTKEEKEMIESAGGIYKLREIYRSTSAEKMKEMWDSLSDAQKIPPKKTKDEKKEMSGKEEVKDNKEEQIEDKMSDSPANDHDAFEDNTNNDDNNEENNNDESSELF